MGSDKPLPRKAPHQREHRAIGIAFSVEDRSPRRNKPDKRRGVLACRDFLFVPTRVQVLGVDDDPVFCKTYGLTMRDYRRTIRNDTRR